MRKIKATVSVGMCDRTTEFQVPDDYTDDEIMEEVTQWANETIDTSWEEIV